MAFLSIFVSSFMLAYFFVWILQIVGVKKYKLISTIVISVYYLSLFLRYFILFVNHIIASADLFNILMDVLMIVSVILSYLAIMYIVHGKLIKFRSKRSREFENSYNGKVTALNPIYYILLIIALLALLFGIVALSFYSKDKLVTIIASFVIAFVLTSISLVQIIRTKKNKNNHTSTLNKSMKIANNLILILENNKVKTYYKHNLTKGETKETVLGKKLCDTFIFDELGTYISPNGKYKVIGMFVSNLDYRYLEDLNMEEIFDQREKDALNNFEKYKQKTIKVDQNYNIIN